MKLAKIAIENFRQLGTAKHPFEISFTDPLDRVRDFTLLVGPNSIGKTTILDAIGAAIGPTLELPAVRNNFKLSPRTVVRRGAQSARVTCWLRFSPDEIKATQELLAMKKYDGPTPDASEIKLMWEYPDPRAESRFGRLQFEPSNGWRLLKARVNAARLLSTGQVDWSYFKRVGSVFTFDQERTGLSKAISRRIWNIIHGETAEDDKSTRRTTDPRTILIDLALRASVPSEATGMKGHNEFERIQERFAQICSPRRIIGPIEDALGEFDIYFDDGRHEYRYDTLSSGERMVLLLLVRFVSEHIHRSVVMIDEMELNQHPIWQRKLLTMIPQMGDHNQIIATTHSPYLRDAVRSDAVIDLGDLGDQIQGSDE